MKNIKTVVGVVSLGWAVSAAAALQLGAPFSDGAVLQRGMKVPVWGSAAPGKSVTVEFAGQTCETVAAADGKWRVDLAPMAASKESRELVVTEADAGWLFDSETDRKVVKDVLVGEVWFASGQSNMECPIWGTNTRYRDGKGGMIIPMTRLPYVRYVKNEKQRQLKPVRLESQWRRFVPEEIHRGNKIRLSAVAFYYARELYLALDVPIGIIDSSWGGTNIDAWTPRSSYVNCVKELLPFANYKLVETWDDKAPRVGTITHLAQQPTVLWNGMVDSYKPMAMRGFIWYQGCHNNSEAAIYDLKMQALYDGWAREFENPALKLYFCQLAPYKSNWNKLVAAQNAFAEGEKNAAIAVLADVGNFDDIHPNDKEVVAKRLAIHALKRDYGFPIDEDDSPVAKSAKFEGTEVTVDFLHVKNWYNYADDFQLNPPFELQGADGKWAPAKIVNWRKGKQKRDGKEFVIDTPYVDAPALVLKSDQVAKPQAVRYMGTSRTSGTMYNEASLPLGPFEIAK